MRIALVNMPFATVEAPSIALTQLRTRVRHRFGDAVAVDIVYANQTFAGRVGIAFYRTLSELAQGSTGVGDWLFRRAAFPEAADNAAEYLGRYYGSWTPAVSALRRALLDARDGVEDYLDGLIAEYDLLDCDIVGCTSMFAQNLSSFALIRRIKERNPLVLTVMGGANCEVPMGTRIARSVTCVDYVFSGPALTTFPEFVAAVRDGRHEDTRIPGVLSAAGLARGDIPTIGASLDIDTEVDLDYDDFLDRLAVLSPDLRPVLYFETSRGCWWGEKAHCTFCGLNGLSMGYRAMAPDRARAMFARLFRYADRCQEFGCVDNIMPKEYLRQVLPYLRPPSGVSLAYEVKANLRDEDVRVLADAQVTKIQPGIEALATSTLKLMRKGSSAFQNLQLLKSCAVSGVEPFWNLLVGFPGEDPAVYRKYLADLPGLSHLPPPSGVSTVRFDRYSPYFSRPQEYGLRLAPFGCYRFLYPWDDEAINEVAYYFTDSGSREYQQRLLPYLPALSEAVDRWRAVWKGTEPSVHLRIDWLPGSARCLDTRFGGAGEHVLPALDADVLWHLREPRRTESLCAALAHTYPAARVREALRRLQERRLVFTEGDRHLCLALDGLIDGWTPPARHHR